MKEKRKLTDKEKKELKDHIKKVSFSILHIISYILSIIFIISIAIGCSKNTQKASAFNYQGVVTTPVVQLPLGASTYQVKATNINASLPQNYSIFLNYPNYDVNESFLPYVWQFDVLNDYPNFTSALNEYYLIPLHNFRGSDDYSLRLRMYYDNPNASYVDYFAIYLGFTEDSLLSGWTNQQISLNKDLFNEIIYYNSYISYSFSNVKYASNLNEYTYIDLPNEKQSRYLNLVRSIWYYFSRDSWVDNLHLTSESIIGANNYLLKDLKYEGLVGKDKNLTMASVINGSSTQELYYFNLQGSFYYKGEVYNSLVFYYEKVYKGSNSEFQLYLGDIQGSSVVNQQLLYDCNDSSYNNLFYLSSVYLAKVPNLNDIFSIFDAEYQALLYHVYESNFVWQGINQHQIFLNLFASQQTISNNNPYALASVGSEYDLPFGYIYPNPSYNIWNFYQNITNTWVIPVIVDNDYSVEDMFAQTYYWMIFAINSFASILSFTILPGITLGAVLLTPLVVTLIIFVAKLFKR